MGMRWDGQERRINHTTRHRIERREDRTRLRALLVGCAIGLLSGVPTGFLLDRPETPPTVVDVVDVDGRYECKSIEGELYRECELVTP